MSSRDKKPTTSRSGNARIRTLSDLNRPSDGRDSDSDSDSDGPSEYYTGGEKSGMLVQDPTKGNKKKHVDAIFARARAQGLEEETPSSSSSSFAGTGRSLAGSYVQPPPQQPEPQQLEPVATHNLVFWRNGFTVDDGPLRSIHDPANAAFLHSISRTECPAELDPGRGARIPIDIHLTRREGEDYIEPEEPLARFRGVGRTLGSSSETPQPNATPMATASTPSAGLIVDESLPSTSIQLRLADGTRVVAHFNLHHTVGHIRSFINASRPGAARAYHLQTVGFPPKALNDDSQTIEQAGLANSVVIQKP